MKKINFEKSRRIENLPPYLFAEIDQMIEEAKSEGVDVISFGVGDPDLPTPGHIVESMKKAVEDPETHSYPSYQGMEEFRAAVADFYRERFGVELDHGDEIISLIGSKEGLAHIPFCYINPGDKAIVPDPSYPVYETSIIMAGGDPIIVPLKKENDFLPDLTDLDEEKLKKTRLIFLNYPNNPTGATASLDFFREIVDLAQKYEFMVIHDSAYSEIYFGQNKPPSLLQVEGGKEVGIEFGSLSKTFNMTGWRLGWAAGKSEIVEALGTFKTNVDSGVFEAIQRAGITALGSSKDCVKEATKTFKNRRDLLVKGLNSLGWDVNKNQATYYIWAEIPEAYEDSQEFSRHIFSETGVFFTPGIGYGEEGRDFVRLALTVSEDRIEEALERLDSNLF